MKAPDDGISGDRTVGTNLHDDIVIVGKFRLVRNQQTNSRQARQRFLISSVVLPIGFDHIRHDVQVRQAHRCRYFDHLAVRSRVNDFIHVAKSEVPHQAHRRGKLIVVGHDSTAFERVKHFGCVEAQDFAFTETADQLSPV